MAHGNSAEPMQGMAGETSEGARLPSRFTYASGARPLDGYTIKRGVGVGGFGEVYYATTDAGKDVALKRIQRNLDVELRGVRQCLNLKHPNLVALFDIKYDAEGQAWVVMEYVAGANLQDLVERHPKGLQIEDVHRWFDGMAAGVEHLHDCGIVHRDLKPGNVFLDQGASKTGTVKIGDYGLSKFISCSRRSGQTQSVGTFHYMAPEIGQGRYGKEIDIYALGIMLYEMLTGHVPFDGESSQEIIMKHLTARPNLAQVPMSYRYVVDRALAKDPAARFASILEMRQAVSECASGTDKRLALQGAGSHHAKRALFDEPIARAVQDSWRGVDRKLSRSSGGTVVKVVLIVLGAIMLANNIRWMIPYALVLGFAYFTYLGMRALVLPSDETDNPAFGPYGRALDPHDTGVNASGVGSAENGDIVMAHVVQRSGPSPKRRQSVAKSPSKEAVEIALRTGLRQRAFAVHGMEFTGALLMSFLVAAVMGIVVLLVPGMTGPEGLRAAPHQWMPMYAWTTLSSVAGAWGVLGLGKVWEGHAGDAARRRFVQLLLGMAVGSFSWALATFLMVRPTYFLETRGPASWHGLHGPDGLPLFPGFLAYFGGLFLVLRWWKQTDPLRRVRLSVWGTSLTVAAALVLHSLCPFPRGFVIATTIAVAVQMAAPWISPIDRKRVANQVRNHVV